MRKASVLLVGILVLLLVASCNPNKKKTSEETTPPIIKDETPPTPPVVTPPEQVTKEEIKQDDLKPIYFDFDRYDLRSGDRETLNKNAMVLKDYFKSLKT